MQAGRLKEVISFQNPVVVKDEFGSTKTEWQTVITTKANVLHVSGSKQVTNHEIFHTYTKTFETRIYHEVNEKMRIVYDGKNYTILAIEKDKDYQKLVITTELINE